MVVVVYRKSESSVKKYITVFKSEQTPDRILDVSVRRPLIPYEYVIDEVGVGTNFIEYYKRQHNIKNHETI